MRLIDADALLKHEIEADRMGAMLVVGKGYILSAPEVDAVPVVRCGKCRISEPSSIGDGWIYCQNNKLHHQKSHFCSYGERKENT